MWKDIKGYEGLYQISDEGQVRRFLKSGETKPVKPREGLYLSVSLSKKGRYISHNIHRLVAESFLEKPKGALEVNHKDGNKWNNHVENLEWVSQRENLVHSIQVLQHFPFGKAPRKVRCLKAVTGELVAEFYSIAEASRAIGTYSARAGITSVCNGYQQTAYGYKWEFAD